MIDRMLYERLVDDPPLTLDELDTLADECGHAGPAGAILAMREAVSVRARELARARRYLAELTSRFSRGEGHDLPAMVELIHGRTEIIRRFQELQRNARYQFRACDAPPYPANDAAVVNTMEVDQLRSGLRFRILYDRTALDIPGRLADLEAGVAAGEQARVTDIPLKLTIFDDTAAILPVRQPADVESRQIEHNPVLLDALSALFEMYWDRALPLHAKGDAVPSDAERRLLVLLVGGLSDDEIAAQLGVSDRTVRRGMRSLMARLDAATRFQAGYQAVLRGWIADVHTGQ